MNLVIDEGNTSVKIGLFNKYELVSVAQFDVLDNAQSYISTLQYKHVLYSSVREVHHNLSFLEKKHITLTHLTELPIKIDYKTPSTLGVDRIALACGVAAIKKSNNVLMIDAGTCITCDLLVENVYMGGVISLGVQMRAKALCHFTGKLPLIDPVDVNEVLGKTTDECINSGVINGAIGEIKYLTDRFVKDYGIEEVFITGGDAMCFDNKLKTPTFVNPYLVLEGLNRILEHNV